MLFLPTGLNSVNADSFTPDRVHCFTCAHRGVKHVYSTGRYGTYEEGTGVCCGIYDGDEIDRAWLWPDLGGPVIDPEKFPQGYEEGWYYYDEGQDVYLPCYKDPLPCREGNTGCTYEEDYIQINYSCCSIYCSTHDLYLRTQHVSGEKCPVCGEDKIIYDKPCKAGNTGCDYSICGSDGECELYCYEHGNEVYISHALGETCEYCGTTSVYGTAKKIDINDNDIYYIYKNGAYQISDKRASLATATGILTGDGAYFCSYYSGKVSFVTPEGTGEIAPLESWGDCSERISRDALSDMIQDGDNALKITFDSEIMSISISSVFVENEKDEVLGNCIYGYSGCSYFREPIEVNDNNCAWMCRIHGGENVVYHTMDETCDFCGRKAEETTRSIPCEEGRTGCIYSGTVCGGGEEDCFFFCLKHGKYVYNHHIAGTKCEVCGIIPKYANAYRYYFNGYTHIVVYKMGVIEYEEKFSDGNIWSFTEYNQEGIFFYNGTSNDVAFIVPEGTEKIPAISSEGLSELLTFEKMFSYFEGATAVQFDYDEETNSIILSAYTGAQPTPTPQPSGSYIEPIATPWCTPTYTPTPTPTATNTPTPTATNTPTPTATNTPTPTATNTPTSDCDHKDRTKHEAVESSCGKKGNKEFWICDDCGLVFDAEKEGNIVEDLASLILPLAESHTYSEEWTVVREATATANGRREKCCTKCGTKKSEVIPATGLTPEPEAPGTETLAKESEVAEDAPVESAGLNNSRAELIAAPGIFTEEEKKAIENGDEAKVYLAVLPVDTALIPKENQVKIENQAAEKLGQNVNIEYMDVSLFKQVGNSEAASISEPGTEIKVSVELPKSLINNDENVKRTYSVIRLHDGTAQVLDAEFNPETGELSYETGLFSTYAIAYADEPVKVPNPPETGVADYTWIIVIVMLLAAEAVVIFRKKQSYEK